MNPKYNVGRAHARITADRERTLIRQHIAQTTKSALDWTELSFSPAETVEVAKLNKRHFIGMAIVLAVGFLAFTVVGLMGW